MSAVIRRLTGPGADRTWSASASVGAALAGAAALVMSGCASTPSSTSSATAQVSPAPPSSAASPIVSGGTTGAGCGTTGRVVRTASALTTALKDAAPGDTILLASGTYAGHFTIASSGTEAAPITLCGGTDAIIDGGSIKSSYALHLTGASWWNITGFTVTGGQKGVVTDRSGHVVISGLHIHDVGDEALHLRTFSSDNTVERVVVRNTGLLHTKFGEGIYVGSAHSNWCQYSSCGPDTSDRNVLRDNDISATTAENIDIKEGTTGGVISQNTLSGAGMVASAATAWINVKGNSWTVSGNTGVQSLKDGFQTHQVSDGWGLDNVFRANTATVDGPGYGFYVQSVSLHAQIACDNVAQAAAAGLSNVRCS